MKIKTKHDRVAIALALHEEFGESRFKFRVSSKGDVTSLATIRLQKAKPYCGNHAKACEGVHLDDHAKRTFLEGADWIEFHDRLNNVLDRLEVDANVFNSAVITRKGRERRVRYESNESRGTPGAENFEWVWDKDGPEDHFKDYCGRTAIPAHFPDGTPGIYEPLGYSVVG